MSTAGTELLPLCRTLLLVRPALALGRTRQRDSCFAWSRAHAEWDRCRNQALPTAPCRYLFCRHFAARAGGHEAALRAGIGKQGDSRMNRGERLRGSAFRRQLDQPKAALSSTVTGTLRVR